MPNQSASYFRINDLQTQIVQEQKKCYFATQIAQ